MNESFDDLRYAWRQLRRTPSFTAVAVLTLALGIGANTTFYALIDAIVWRPSRGVDFSDVYTVGVARPYKRPLPGTRAERNAFTLTPNQLAHVKADPALGVLATANANQRFAVAQTPAGAVHTTIGVVTGEYAAVHGMRPLLGTLSGLNDDGPQAGPVIVISEGLWRRVFKSNATIVGREQLRLDGRTLTVAGIARREQAPMQFDAWVAAAAWPRTADRLINADLFATSIIRVRPGVARARLTASIDASLAKGPTPPQAEFKAFLNNLPASIFTQQHALNLTLMVVGLSALVLIAACANLANLLYARAAQRTGEIAVRLSLGAGGVRIFRLFLLETTLIAAAASALGLVIAWTALRWVDLHVPTTGSYSRFDMPADVSPDWRMFVYAAGAGIVAAVVVGGLSAWRASRVPPLRMFGASGIAMATPARGKWLRTLLVAIQVSAAVILLLGTGLYLIRAMTGPRTSVTYAISPLATARVVFGESYRPDQATDVMAAALEQVRKIDGVETAAIVNGVIGATTSGGHSLRNLVAEDEAMPGRMSSWRTLEGQRAAVSAEFLATIGLRTTAGRAITPNDREGAPEVVMLSSSAAQSLWPGLDPIGKRVRLSGDPRWFNVIGIFEDPARNREDTKWVCSACVALTPWRQWPGRTWLIVARSAQPAAVAQQLVAAVAAVDERVPVFDPSVARRGMFAPRNAEGIVSELFAALGAFSLAIAGLGVYGVISYSVSRRTREFGIRLALGATPRGILRAVLDDAVHLVLVGLLPGVLLASWGTRVIEAGIFKLMPNDIPTWAAVPIVILVIGVFAAYIPARRAARVDPNVALRDL